MTRKTTPSPPCMPRDPSESPSAFNRRLLALEQATDITLRAVGEDPRREGLRETPRRVALAWLDWTRGYEIVSPGELLKTFEHDEEADDGLVMVENIEFYSHCEHHLAPFFGTATIGYIPQGKVAGLSKFGRVVDAYAQRLQMQERLTNQIADCINDALVPLGVGVLLRARHFCMCSRGVAKQHSRTTTSALRGVFKDATVRAEFMALVKD